MATLNPSAPREPSRRPEGPIALRSLAASRSALLFLSSCVVICLSFVLFSVRVTMSDVSHTAPSASNKEVVIVGAGLAGLSAAVEAVTEGASVIVIDKNTPGGNSQRATSGISGAVTKAQQAAGIKNDSVAIFLNDVLVSGQGQPHHGLAHVLTSHSALAVDFLETILHKSLDSITILGGHSVPRTHRLPVKPGSGPAPIGAMCIRALTTRLQQDDVKDRVKILTKTRVTDFHILENSMYGPRVTHVTVSTEDGETQQIPAGAVILASGGFSADIGDQGLVSQYSPFASKSMYTTNGAFATGDLLKIAQRKDIATVDLDKVQLHPTGFVNPKDPDAKEKMLCPEYVRGLGGLLLNKKGERFTNELNRRDAVSAAILEHGSPPTAWNMKSSLTTLPQGKENKLVALLLNEDIISTIGEAVVGFYMSKNLIKKVERLEGVAEELGCPAESLQATLSSYREAAAKQRDEFGKTTFPTVIQLNDPHYYIAYVTPAVHYTMGGLCINEEGQVFRGSTDQRHPIANLFAAGEVAGGVHGANRLGGNGILESVVFGRVTGRNAAHIVQDMPRSVLEYVERNIAPQLTVRSIMKLQDGPYYLLRLSLPSLIQTSMMPLALQFSFTLQLQPPRHPLAGNVTGWFVAASPSNAQGYIDAILPVDQDSGVAKLEVSWVKVTRTYVVQYVLPGDVAVLTNISDVTPSLYTHLSSCRNTDECISVNADTGAVGAAAHYLQISKSATLEIRLMTQRHDVSALQSLKAYLHSLNPRAQINISPRDAQGSDVFSL